MECVPAAHPIHRSLYPLSAKNHKRMLNSEGKKTEFSFSFADYASRVLICQELPNVVEITGCELTGSSAIIVCDTNTESLARQIVDGYKIPTLVLKSGEASKNWESVQKILSFGLDVGLGRDGFFVAVGGGVICDLTALAASLYKRGANLCLLSTSLLGMIDASLGGKTGINLFGLKNFAGTFYPAGNVILPLSALDSLPEREWKSGMAELIKTAILGPDGFLEMVKELFVFEKNGRDKPGYRECLRNCISMATAYKGRIVEEDPFDKNNKRALLNLGHSFAHALEAAAGLGELSHGEAVAWGIVRACELGLTLGITPLERAKDIATLISSNGYEIRAPHPLLNSGGTLLNYMQKDKKNTAGKFRFVVPGLKGAEIVSVGNSASLEDGEVEKLLGGILYGKYSF